MGDIIQPTVAASLVVVLYLVIEKVVVPLAKGRHDGDGRNRKGDDDRHQEYINNTVDHRLNEHSRRISDLNQSLTEIGTAVSVIEEIVRRIEERTK